MRGSGLNKQDRQALLEQIAAKRLQQKNTSAAFRGLEDSDSEEDSFVTAPSKAVSLLDDSSEEENQGPRGRAPPAGGSKLNRLRKASQTPLPTAARQEQPQSGAAGPDDGAPDDLSSLLGGLSIQANPGYGRSASSSAHGAACAVVGAPRTRLDLAPSQHTAQAVGRSGQPAADGVTAGCLLLGDKGEFRLK